ncbi:MAG: 7-cyano-7-deazaguanine synthase [Prevotellaceae bacterium]|jgi:7-cyano-7-deazaguanine synthase in queuosine biosynthesis|nr:7-cyano-7-deazaguanine synthase [Prevotellaceae bacterium]
MQKSIYNKKVLLYSGGMDSWLIGKIWNPDIKLYVDMNTAYSRGEINRLPSDVIVEKLDLSKWERTDKIIPLRNIYLINIACNYGNEICLGATAGDRVLDKSPQFAEQYEKILTYLFQKQHWTEERKIKINLDFKRYTKTELLRLFIKQGGDIVEAHKKSFSCYNPDKYGRECENCKSCFRKFVAFALNGYNFPMWTIHKNMSYIKSEILPLIESGSYGRKSEEKEILKVIELYKDK